MLIGEYVQQFEPGINDANNTANSALVQSQEALDQAKNATAIANEALGQSRASVIELINSVNASTVTLIGNKNDGSQTTTNLPVASELQAGVMNTATYVNLKDLNSRVTSLESNTTTYIVVLPNDNPTQAEILNAYRTAYPLAPNPPLDGTTVIDVDKQLFYRYVKNGTVWIKTSGFNVTPFTNENAGIIKGSTTPGQVQAETDGTGSLVGYDTLVSNIAQNTASIGTANGRIDAVETKNTEQDTAITRAQTSANNAFAGASISKNANNQILNLSRGAGAGVNLNIDAVDTQNAGLVTPAMFNQWNNGDEPYKMSNNFVTDDVITTPPTYSITTPNGNITVTFRHTGGGDYSLTATSIPTNLKTWVTAGNTQAVEQDESIMRANVSSGNTRSFALMLQITSTLTFKTTYMMMYFTVTNGSKYSINSTFYSTYGVTLQ